MPMSMQPCKHFFARGTGFSLCTAPMRHTDRPRFAAPRAHAYVRAYARSRAARGTARKHARLECGATVVHEVKDLSTELRASHAGYRLLLDRVTEGAKRSRLRAVGCAAHGSGSELGPRSP